MVIGPDDAMCRAGRTFELGLGKNKVLRNPSVSRAAGRKAGQGQSAPAGIRAAAKEGVGWVERGGDGGARRGSVHCETSVRSVCEQCRPSLRVWKWGPPRTLGPPVRGASCAQGLELGLLQFPLWSTQIFLNVTFSFQRQARCISD